MKLLDRYMYEVRNHLPRSMQADLEIEIRSLIEDTLEDRSQTTGREIDEALTAEVLQEFGPPEKVTAAYLPEKYLIGPQLYPTFITVLRIVLIVIAILAMVGAGISIVQSGDSPQETMQAVLTHIGGLYSAALQAFGMVVFIFAIIQWARGNVTDKPKTWSPSQLEDVTHPDLVKPSSPIVEIVFALIVLVLFNFYPHLIGLYSFTDGEWLFAPIFTETFFNYGPWISLILLIKLLENLILLRQGHWQPITRGLSIAGSIFNIALLFTMLTGPALANLGPETFAAFGWTVDAASRLNSLNNSLVNLILMIILALEVFDLGSTIYQMAKRKPVSLPTHG
ncbi:MAG TPA: hypothetical protein VLH85_06660 [Levilinea sp.]|nr:hypothetical protein [Levilinea sp.]